MNDHIPAEDFAAYLDGMLNPEKKNELESHFSRCPACQDELLEIAAIMRGRDKVLAGGQGKVLAGGQGKIPAGFLNRALGEKSKTTKPVLHLRLVFEIAAALVVVVFIGYLFLDNNRFWQTPEQQKTPVAMDKNVRLADPSTSVGDEGIAPLQVEQRDRADAKKTRSEGAKTYADQDISDSFASEKRERTVVGKGMSAAGAKSIPTSEQENKLKEIVEEQPRPVTEKESLPKKELARTATIPETAGEAHMDFAAKDQAAAKVMKETAAEAEQNRERQKKPGVSKALSIEAKANVGKLKDDESSLRSSVAVPKPTVADQPAFPPIRIEGDAVWNDLRNPELVFTWSWFQKDLVLELQIDGAGTVVAVVPLGKIDPLLARQAENEAKKLLFSVSKKKSRRARLIANELPPN